MFSIGGSSGFQGILNKVLKDSSGNLVSYIKANQEAQQKRIEEIMEAFGCAVEE